MNVNVSSSTEPTKVSKGLVESKSASTEPAEGDGFFAKLTAFIKGEAKAKEAKDNANIEVGTKLEAEATAVAAEEQTDEATAALGKPSTADGILESDDLDASVAAEKSAAESEADFQIPSELEKFIEKPAQAQASSAQAEKAMSESEQLIGRLDQAAKTLQTKDGNALPLQGVSSDAIINETKTTNESVTTQTALETAALANSSADLSGVADENTSTLHGETLDLMQISDADKAAAQLADQSPPTDANTLNTSAESLSEQAVKAAGEQSETATIAWNSQTGVVASEAAKLGKEDVVLKANGQTSAVLMQQTHQALQQNASQAQQAANQSQSANSATLTPNAPMDISAEQQLQAVTAPVSSAAQSEQIMQAAMGLKGTAALGKLGKQGDNQPGAGLEATLAQQLGHLAGQQGVNGALRPEQVAQQPAMQLSRELAPEQIADRVQVMLSKNLKNIDIRLDPPELGRMQIRMNMNGDLATVHFTVANQQARDIVEQAMPRLREMLAQQGLQLGDTSVEQQSAGQQQDRYAASNEQGSGQGNSKQHLTSEENLELDVKLDLNVATKRDGISYYA